MDRRSYNQYCGAARALDLVGERWTLLIVRDLALGPLRYSDLLRGLPGITTNLLAKRLREMEEGGLVERIRGATSDGHSYRLTPLGAGLEPVVQALAAWGLRAADAPPARGERRRFEWLLFALRGRYLGKETLRAELTVDGVPYRVLLAPDTADICRGDVASPDIRLSGSSAAVARLLLQPRGQRRVPPGVEVQGSPDLLRRLLASFDTSALAFVGDAIKTA